MSSGHFPKFCFTFPTNLLHFPNNLSHLFDTFSPFPNIFVSLSHGAKKIMFGAKKIMFVWKIVSLCQKLNCFSHLLFNSNCFYIFSLHKLCEISHFIAPGFSKPRINTFISNKFIYSRNLFIPNIKALADDPSESNGSLRYLAGCERKVKVVVLYSKQGF